MADTANESEKYKVHLPLGKAMAGDVYVPELKEHRFYLKGKPWIIPTQMKVIESTEITPNLTVSHTVEIREFKTIDFRIGEQ
jgi:hypothetical protein